jgi:hypothetical protein
MVGQGGSNAGGNGSSAGSSSDLDPSAACVTSSATGEPIPVDLYFMVDITGSMNCPVPDDPAKPCDTDPGAPYASTTRWTMESAALKSFVSSRANAGLGVGMDFFPRGKDYCSASSYQTPTVEIAALPGSSAQLTSSIGAQKPAGMTPTFASLTAATQHATAWAKAHKGHRVAVVYATDGYPKGCDSNNTISSAAKVAQAALNASPSIQTYVLGVGSNLSSLDQIASAGGTDHAYLIDTGEDATQQFAAALGTIRQNALLGCTYTIPPAPAGQTLDYGKVNVRYTTGSGEVIDVAKDPSATACNQGWQYSADKSQIDLCGDVCNTVKKDTGGSLEILFGCSTVVGPIR